jgi:hypothetical protein
MQRKRVRDYLSALTFCLLISILLLHIRHTSFAEHSVASDTESRPQDNLEALHHESDAVTLVVASQKKDDTSWLNQSFPTWDKAVYVTDDPDAPLAVPANKGREGIAYLT